MNFMAIHPTVLELFRSGLKWWNITRATLLTWLKIIGNMAALCFHSECNQRWWLISHACYSSLTTEQCWKLLFLFRSDGEIKARLKKEPNWKKPKTLELWCPRRSLIHHGRTTTCTNLSARRSGTLPSRCSSFLLCYLLIHSGLSGFGAC